MDVSLFHYKVISQSVYDGSQLSPGFAYKASSGAANVVLFRAPMKLSVAEMVDMEDVVNNDSIGSDDALNIIIELPYTNLVGAVAIQRVICRVIADVLQQVIGVPIIVEGDDLMVHGKKLSVSIATSAASTMLVHIGINIRAGDSVPNVMRGKVASLFDYIDKEVLFLPDMLGTALVTELNSIYSASLKVLPK